MKFKSAVVIAIVMFFAAVGYGSPPYIEKCRRSDPNLHDCILNSAKKALPEIMKGDPSIHIPNLRTYDTQDQTLDVHGITYTLKNIKHNSGELEPTDVRLDFAPNVAEIAMHLPFLVWKADFTAKGEYKGKPIDASGKTTINYDGVRFNYTRNCEEKDIDGKIHLQVKSDSTVGDVEKISIVHNYDEKAIGKDELDALIPEIKSALETRLQEICSQIVTFVLNAILKTTPRNEIFLP